MKKAKAFPIDTATLVGVKCSSKEFPTPLTGLNAANVSIVDFNLWLEKYDIMYIVQLFSDVSRYSN